jgi:hypothetical protein
MTSRNQFGSRARALRATAPEHLHLPLHRVNRAPRESDVQGPSFLRRRVIGVLSGTSGSGGSCVIELLLVRRDKAAHKEKPNMRRRFNCDPKWITVRYPAKCAEPNCQTLINASDRAFYYPSVRALYGSGRGHGEKAERDFAAHRIDENGY